MRERCTFRWLRRLVLALVVGAAPCAQAQSLEAALSPGKLIEGHAKVENECQKCHVHFDRAAQDRLCTDCHKEVGQDLRQRTGAHGRMKPQPCRTCHTDHKGRDVRIAEFDHRKFDHAQTDFLLRGAHAKVECTKCHETGKKFRLAPQECVACHRKDDTHKGSLGAKCADCHTENNWKETRFDHGKTRFALTGRHVDAKCASCHKSANYKEAPMTCVGCHRVDDERKGHKGTFGERCDSCHDAKAWKPSTFKHDTDTRYALRGKHRATRCADCHTGHLYRDKAPTACADCHRKDDKHKGTLGRECAACHTERDWKETGKFDHARTSFALLGKHVDVKCAECHKASVYKDAPKDCYSCHRKDDKHERTLGQQCQDCHVERDWKTTTRFDHARTRFPLRNAHAARKVQCRDCHGDLKKYRDTPLDCVSCHRKDDKHEGQVGAKCESCHDDRDWKKARFDHRQARFALLGRHLAVACKDCHATPRYRDAARDCYSCHKKDDRHKLKFGVACESCHNARAWGIWDFDHARRARYALDGAHAKVACEQCHAMPAPRGRNAAELGSSCNGCHRRDDRHDGAFGPGCNQCHVTESWKRIRSRLGAGPGWMGVWQSAALLEPANWFSDPHKEVLR